jgi:glyoxylase I family protein
VQDRARDEKMTIRIDLATISVNNQERALNFYTHVLGFVVAQDFPVGEFRWITVQGADGSGAQLSLEPDINAATIGYQNSLFSQGIPSISFGVDNLDDEYQRLISQGVEFTVTPTNAGPVRIAIFDDTCGNLIQLHEVR